MEERWWRTDGAVVYGAGSSRERRSFAREVAGGGVSALVPAPLIRLGCVLDASTCGLKDVRKQ